jgi:RimJ/RimL family protein N-acetyltransferase
MTQLFDTPRLAVRPMEEADAGFMLALLNDPGWIANIGDRGVRTIDEAEAHIRGNIKQYGSAGLGAFLVTLKATAEPIGMLTLISRDGLDGPDLGFAFLAPHVGQGYGREAATATIGWAEKSLGIHRLFAITALENPASIGLLMALGFREAGFVPIPSADDPSRLFERNPASS